MVDGFSNIPDDSDRIFPPGIEEGFDPFTATMFGSNDFEGVPVPYTFQLAQRLGEQQARLDEGDELRTVVAEGTAIVEESEAKYPGSPMWDRQRYAIASVFLGAGHVETAMDFVHSIRSPHSMAAGILNLAAEYSESGNDGNSLTEAFAQRLREDGDMPRYLGFVRAVADRGIEEHPDSPLIDMLEQVLAQHDPLFDPLQSWVESQKEVSPDNDWDNLAAHITHEEHWTGVPLNFRRFAIKQFTIMLDKLKNQPNAETVAEILGSIETYEARYPQASNWNGFRVTFAHLMIRHDQVRLGRQFGEAVTDGADQYNLMVELLDGGHGAEAFELAKRLRDPKLKVASLLGNGGWGGKGFQYIGEIIENNDGTFSIEERIACMEVVRDRYLAQGDTETAGRWSDQIEILRRQ